MVSRVEKNPAFPKPDAKDPYGDMLRAWAAQNGAINAPGARFVAAKPVPAPASSCADDPRSRTAKVTLGGLTYLAVFKSGVFALDPKKKTCALVYFPPDSYQWVDQLKVTGAWIAMRNRDTQKFVYYNPKTRQLSTVQPR